MRLIIMLLGLVFISAPVKAAEAVFAGGCFWCMESEFESQNGVSAVDSGYAGGHVENPTYKQVSEGNTGHKEVVRVTYDPNKVSYKELLEIFWTNVDPFDDKGQFCDKGEQYLAAIFVANEEERKLAEVSKEKVEKRFGKKIATQILPAATFYPAEEHHQDYYLKNEWRYKLYKGGCGRDSRLEDVWGKDAK